MATKKKTQPVVAEEKIVEAAPVEEVVETTETLKVSGCSKLRIRKAPSTNAEVSVLVEEGTELTVVSHNSEWAEVKAPKKFVGYAMAAYLSK